MMKGSLMQQEKFKKFRTKLNSGQPALQSFLGAITQITHMHYHAKRRAKYIPTPLKD